MKRMLAAALTAAMLAGAAAPSLAVDGHGNAQIEIRQIITAEDLGFSEEQRERYAKLEAEAAQQQ